MSSLSPPARFIRNGEPVSAGVANRPIGDLKAQIDYLWSLIRQASTGSALFARLQTVEAEAEVGMPVYYNATNERFERGLTAVASAPVGNTLVPADSAQIWGCVYQKLNSTLADIVLVGFTALDISAAVEDDVEAGLYYLSGTTPGGLQRTRPAVAVPVLRSDGRGNVYVLSQAGDALDRHTHQHFRLSSVPAGDSIIPPPGEPHVIDNPDASLAGWLPADHPSFDGHAPAAAKFGYNLAADPELAAVWPPVPSGSAYLELDRGVDPDQGMTGVQLGSDGMCIIDAYGIWWLSDCAGDAPWPANENFGDGSVSQSLSVPAEPDCPKPLPFRMDIWFTRLNTAEASS